MTFKTVATKLALADEQTSHPDQPSSLSDRIPFNTVSTKLALALSRTDIALNQPSYLSDRIPLKTVPTKLAHRLRRISSRSHWLGLNHNLYVSRE
jgi:hypothetical protein